MSPESRTTVLFWCQVGLYVTAMVLMLGVLAASWYFVVSGIHALDESRQRERVMLDQHRSEMQAHARFLHDHDRASEQQAEAFTRTTQAFDAMLHNHQTILRELAR